MPRAPSKKLLARQARVAAVLPILKRTYPDAKCSLDFRNPLELIVATILSAQCTDERVNIVTKDLFQKYRSAGDYAKRAAGDAGEGHPVDRLLPQQGQEPARHGRGARRAARRARCRETMDELTELARRRPQDGQRRARQRVRQERRRHRRHPRHPRRQPARPDRPPRRRGEDRAGPDAGRAAGGVDDVVPPADPPRPGDLPGAQAEVRAVPAAAALPGGAEVHGGRSKETGAGEARSNPWSDLASRCGVSGSRRSAQASCFAALLRTSVVLASSSMRVTRPAGRSGD